MGDQQDLARMREAMAHVVDLKRQLRMLQQQVGWTHKRWLLSADDEELVLGMQVELSRWQDEVRLLAGKRGVPVPPCVEDDA